MEKEKAIKEFKEIREKAELKALSRHSLIEPLTNKEFKRMKELSKKYFGIELKGGKNKNGSKNKSR